MILASISLLETPTVSISFQISGQSLKVSNLIKLACVILLGSGIAPSPRAAHASGAVD